MIYCAQVLLQWDTEFSDFSEFLPWNTDAVISELSSVFTVRYWAQCFYNEILSLSWFYSEILSSVLLQWDTEFSAFIERYWFQCFYIEILSSVLLQLDTELSAFIVRYHFIAFTLRYGFQCFYRDTELRAFKVWYRAQCFCSEILSSGLLERDTEFSAFTVRYWAQSFYSEILSSVLSQWDTELSAFTVRYWAAQWFYHDILCPVLLQMRFWVQVLLWYWVQWTILSSVLLQWDSDQCFYS